MCRESPGGRSFIHVPLFTNKAGPAAAWSKLAGWQGSTGHTLWGVWCSCRQTFPPCGLHLPFSQKPPLFFHNPRIISLPTRNYIIFLWQQLTGKVVKGSIWYVLSVFKYKHGNFMGPPSLWKVWKPQEASGNNKVRPRSQKRSGSSLETSERLQEQHVWVESTDISPAK